MKSTLLISLSFLLTAFAYGQQPFITTWKVTANDLDIGIPADSSAAAYNYNVNFGDSTTVNNVKDSITHVYTAPGIYTVTISGTFPKIDWTKVNGFNRKQLLSIEQWGDMQWAGMNQAFAYCSNLTIPATDTPDFNMVSSTAGMFRDDTLLNNAMNHWDVSHVTNMQYMFEGAKAFNQPLNNWNVSNVTNMTGIFKTAVSFNQPLNNWNVAQVINMKDMFNGATAFNGNIGAWNTGAVTNMEGMFFAAVSFNQPVNNWNVANVDNMGELFALASSFNQALNNWNVSGASSMASMFSGAKAFNQPLNNWNVNNVMLFQSMFNDATAFNQPLNNWNIANTNASVIMTAMFRNATNFNQNLSGWTLNNNIVLREFVKNSGLNTANYDSLLIRFDNLNLTNIEDFEADSLRYCNDSAHAHLVNKGWDITGDAKDANCNATTAVEDIITGSLKLYPNPVADYINIEINTGNYWQNATISNIQGQQLLKFRQPQTALYVGELPSGLYIINISTKNRMLIQKFVKN